MTLTVSGKVSGTDGAQADCPSLQILYLQCPPPATSAARHELTTPATDCHPRLVVQMGANASFCLKQSFHSLVEPEAAATVSLTNSHTSLSLGDSARCWHTYEQDLAGERTL